MYRDTEKMAAEIAKFSARDAKTFKQLVADYGEFHKFNLLPLMYSPPLPSLQSAQLEQSEEGRASCNDSTPVQLLHSSSRARR